MLALRLARGTRPLAALRRLMVATASAGVGFLLLTALGHASVPQLLWCAVPILATVHLAVAVARTDPSARPSPGLASAGFGPVRVPVLAALSTALTCLLGSAVALLAFLHLRGGVGLLSHLPYAGEAARLLGGTPPNAAAVPPVGALTLLISLPLVAAAASAVSLRPRRALPGSAAESAAAEAAARATTLRGQAAAPGVPAPSDLPWGTALVATGLALGAYAGEFADQGKLMKLTLPFGIGHASPPVVASWGVIAIGLVLAGPGLTHLCGRVLSALRPGPLRLLAGRVLQEESRRIGRPLGALCAVLAGILVALTLPEQASGRVALGPITALGAGLVVACAVATVVTASLETKKAREHTTAALLRLGASPRVLRGAAALRAAALLTVFAPLSALVAQLAALPLR
ncbi:hypothetical protein [Streptomyces boninensis]|uniref:hypothetical protein n=1 Tax=Streptomyces boninensis TaxID=2039455 RepID=UPI003B2215EF